jgi:hypothetical protein
MMFYNLNGQSVSVKPDAITISAEEVKSFESRSVWNHSNYRELYDRVNKFRASKSATIAFTSNIQPPTDQYLWQNSNEVWWNLFHHIDAAVDKRMAPILDRVYIQENLYKAFQDRFERTKENVLRFDQNTKDAAKRKKERDILSKNVVTNQTQLSTVMPVMIPEIGTKMILAEDWHMELHNEYRNSSVLELTEIVKKKRNWDELYGANTSKHTELVFPKGTILSVDRIYIRKGASGFSSLTFYADKKVKILRDGKEYISTKSLRFWAKLKDVNNMKVQFVEETVVK